MRIKQIFLDLDDVLNYCTMGVLKYLDCQVEPKDIHLFKPEWGWNIVKAANCLSNPCVPWNEEDVWNCVNRDFWATAQKTPWCDRIVYNCAAIVGRENVYVLTSPTNDPDCAAGKVEWIQSMLPDWMHRQYIIAPDKRACADSRSLLIDDRDQNVLDFVSAGGNAILFPRPWNSLHAVKDADFHVFQQLNRSIWR